MADLEKEKKNLIEENQQKQQEIEEVSKKFKEEKK